jgi:hypothetical protein
LPPVYSIIGKINRNPEASCYQDVKKLLKVRQGLTLSPICYKIFLHKGVNIRIIDLLVILTCAAGFGAGIWLAIIGQWLLLPAGILMSIAMPYVYFLASFPKMATIPRLIQQTENEKKVKVAFFGFINAAYDYTLIAVWALLVFGALMNRDLDLNLASLPFFLWGYAVLMAPLVFMAKKEDSIAIGSIGGLTFALLGYAGLTICRCVNAPFKTAALIFIVLVIAFSTIQIGLAIGRLGQKEKLI